MKKAKPVKVCEWENLRHCAGYDTSCKKYFYFEIGFKYCPYCGRKIKVVKNG